MSISIKPSAGGAPGHAELHVSPWDADVVGVALSVVSNAPTNNHLDAQAAKWGGMQQWITLQGAQARGGALVMPVGPAFVDTLFSAPQGVMFRGFVRVGDGNPVSHVLRIEQGVLPSTAAGHTPSSSGNSQLSAPTAAEPPVELVEAPPMRPVADEPVETGGSSKLPIILGAVVLLGALSAAAWFFLLQNKDAPESVQPEERVETPVPTVVACSKESLATAAEISFVQDCVRDIQDSAAMLAIIQDARDMGKCAIAQRLYSNRASAGDAVIALAYAQEYDPVAYKENACFKADAATAAYWYQTVLEQDKENTQAQERLKELAK